MDRLIKMKDRMVGQLIDNLLKIYGGSVAYNLKIVDGAINAKAPGIYRNIHIKREGHFLTNEEYNELISRGFKNNNKYIK